MKKKPIATADYKKMSDPAFQSKSKYISSCMKGNKYFPKPVPSLKSIDAAIDKFSAALLLAASGDRSRIAQKKALRAALEELLTQLRSYVNYTAYGDPVKLLTSGFSISGLSTNITAATPQITNFKVIAGHNSGEAIASVKAIKGASYTVCYAVAPVVNDSWRVLPRGRSKNTIAGLTPRTEYSVRITVTLNNGQTLYSPVVNIIVL